MSVIGTLTPSKDGGWIGIIHTLMINAKIRLVPNDNRNSENAPTFRVFIGRCRIGDAWQARSTAKNPQGYLRIKLDDPSFAEPLDATLFLSEAGNEAQLVWNRRRPVV